MRTANRVSLNWKRPSEWDKFLETIEDDHGAAAPYAGFEIERAWKEYRNEHPAEDYVSRLARAVGIRGRPIQEKNQLTRSSDEGGQRVGVRVQKQYKDEMAAYARDKGVPTYKILRAVVCWYLDGGRIGRITKKLEGVVPEIEEQLATLDRDDDRGLTTEEKKPRWLATYLMPDDGVRGEFTADEFGKALDEMPYRGRDTDHMRDEWLSVVLDRLDYTRHPNNPDVFVPEERAREYVDEPADLDAPAVDRLPYADLSGKDLVRGLRVEAVRKAADRANRRYALKVEAVRDEVFDGGPSKRKAKALMDEAAQTDGFATDAKGGQKRLKVDLSEVVDCGILSDAGLDTDGSDETTETEETDAGDVENQMDDLMNASAVTDGGERN